MYIFPLNYSKTPASYEKNFKGYSHGSVGAQPIPTPFPYSWHFKQLFIFHGLPELGIKGVQRIGIIINFYNSGRDIL